jgi:NAD+ synthetase
MFPELVLTGYPPGGLLLRPDFTAANLDALSMLLPLSNDIGLILGLAGNNTGRGRPLHNLAALLDGGKVKALYRKRLLSRRADFDETRYFEPGGETVVAEFRGKKIALLVCRDLWNEPGTDRTDPVAEAAARGAELVCAISASPYSAGRPGERAAVAARRAKDSGIPILAVNQFGAADGLIFDGTGIAAFPDGTLAAAKTFDEDFLVVDTEHPHAAPPHKFGEAEEIFSALVVGVREYAAACGIPRAVIGLSGGLDSSVTAALAAAALGPGNVTCVAMPGPYSSPISEEDAQKLAENLGCAFSIVPITEHFNAMRKSLAPIGLKERSVAEENLQARLRGTVLMTLSNASGSLVLATGNKSEIAAGYATLYGDTVGALEPIGDVYKTMVYRLAGFINREEEVIPKRVLERKPSAELAPGQVDEDTLPPYAVLDEILKLYIEENKSIAEIVKAGFDERTARRVASMVHTSEFKRYQSAPVLKVSAHALEPGRMPLNHGWD